MFSVNINEIKLCKKTLLTMRLEHFSCYRENCLFKEKLLYVFSLIVTVKNWKADVHWLVCNDGSQDSMGLNCVRPFRWGFFFSLLRIAVNWKTYRPKNTKKVKKKKSHESIKYMCKICLSLRTTKFAWILWNAEIVKKKSTCTFKFILKFRWSYWNSLTK